jgi:uncharacterized protein (TIGR02996 family)
MMSAANVNSGENDMPPTREGKAKGTRTPATAEQGFLNALKESPEDTTTRLVFADWLEEQGRLHEALQQRVQAGVAKARYHLRRKSDGLFAEARTSSRRRRGRAVAWSTEGRAWSDLGHLKAHLRALARNGSYDGTPWSDLEIVVFEVRPQLVATLPFSFSGKYPRKVLIDLSEGRPTAAAAPAEEKPKRGRKKR